MNEIIDRYPDYRLDSGLISHPEFIEEITLALATFQGPWNEKSSKLIMKKMVPLDEEGLRDASLAEKALAKVLEGGIKTFMGDGSASHMFFGHPVMLTAETRGIIILDRGIAFGEDDTGGLVAKYVASSLLLAELNKGNSYEKIESRLKMGILGIFSLITNVQKGLKKLHPNDSIEGDVLADSEINDVLTQLRTTYGGSKEKLIENREKLKVEALEVLKKKIKKRKNSPKLKRLRENLELGTGDEIIDTGIEAAKEILIQITN